MAHTGEAPVLRRNDPNLNCVRFGVVVAIFFVVITWAPNRLFDPLNHATVVLTGYLLSLAGAVPVVQGATVVLKNFKVEVITECSGIYLVALFAAFVIAFPVPLKARLTGILLGIPFLNAANIVRIAGVIIIGAWRPSLFEYAHVYLAQVIMLMLVCVACLVWCRWASASRTSDAPFDFLVRFVTVASILFILWLPMHREYVALLDRLVIYLFSLVNFILVIPPRPEIYHHTLSLIVFASMVCASRGVSSRRKAYGLAGGLSVLVLIHILFRVTNVLLTAMHMEAVLPIHATIYVVNQYLLPVLLWLMVIRQRETSRTRPLCGSGATILSHILLNLPFN